MAHSARPKRSRSTVTDTPAFRRWFGDSKVVDENGEPLVVYHGTKEDFSEFSFHHGINAPVPRAAYFSDSKQVAVDAAGWGKTRVLECYLRITNPLVIDAEGADAIHLTEQVTSRLKRQHDGVIIENVREFFSDQTSTTYAVFDPRQIKSATDNEGTFDPENADMRKNPERTFKPPVAVAKRAQYGQYLRAQMPASKQCCVETGLRRGEQLATRSPVSVHDMVVMRAWFARHEVDKRGKGWEHGSEGYPSKGRQAWELWGGDEGREWVETTLDKLGE